MPPDNLSVALQAIREFEFKHRRRVFGCTRRHKQFNQLLSDRVPMPQPARRNEHGARSNWCRKMPTVPLLKEARSDLGKMISEPALDGWAEGFSAPSWTRPGSTPCEVRLPARRG